MNGLRSAKALSESKPHGTRLKYMGGCKCIQCRAANSRYETERAIARKRGESNGIISAENVQRHLLALSKAGIGRRTVADISGVGITAIVKLRNGTRTQCREATARAILAVGTDVLTDAAIISVKPTLRLVRLLVNEGFTHSQLANRLGYKSNSLQLNPSVITAKKANRIQKFYNRIMAE